MDASCSFMNNCDVFHGWETGNIAGNLIIKVFIFLCIKGLMDMKRRILYIGLKK